MHFQNVGMELKSLLSSVDTEIVHLPSESHPEVNINVIREYNIIYILIYSNSRFSYSLKKIFDDLQLTVCCSQFAQTFTSN